MMSMSQTAKVLGGDLKGSDIIFDSVAIDTRTLNSGAIYFAIKGDRFDGHDFLQQAKEAGAVAAVVDDFSDLNLVQIKVVDTRKALGCLASNWRQKFKGVVVGVTGSNGKTTVKEMIAAIFSKQGNVLATSGNFNNDIGLPLTLLRMKNEHDFAVIEMGANHKGEIDELTHITMPDIALVTNAGSAHLEGFGSRQGIAEAKGEIFSGLSEKGIAVINADDEYANYWLSLCKAVKVISFSLGNKTADVTGEWQSVATGGKLKVHTKNNDVEITLKVPGRHNAMNALAAIAVAQAANISLQNAQQALNEFEAVQGRLNIHETPAGSIVIDDTYNANPESLFAGLEVLMGMSGEHWLVLGEMGELGSQSSELHRDVGLRARQMGIDCLYAIGENNKVAIEEFGEGGKYFEDQNALIDYLIKTMRDDLNILVKGSRFMQMEKVVNALIKGDESCC